MNIQCYQVKDDPDHEAAAGTDSNVLLIAQIVEGDLELVATWARVRVELLGLVKSHVLDLDLIVDGDVLVVRHVCDGDSSANVGCKSKEDYRISKTAPRLGKKKRFLTPREREAPWCG